MARIALTFDDDPKIVEQNGIELGTAELLRIVEELSDRWQQPIHLTFFVVGKNLERCLFQDSSLIDRLQRGGHEIANHTYSHPRNFHRLPIDQAIKEVSHNHATIEALFGRAPVLFRPPYGLISPPVANAILQAFPQYRIVGWDRHDEKDSYKPHQLSAVVTQAASDGQIVLLHVWYQNTLWAMRQILTDLHQRQFQFVRLSDLKNPAIALTQNGLKDTA
jgi:peptidoglycan/xylan/chitin deacetylase (PgdA/CDA1 family)